MRAISFILCLLLVGCATRSVVNLPTPINCAVLSIPEKVKLPIAELTKDSSSDVVTGAYIKTVRILIIDNNDLRTRMQEQSRLAYRLRQN